MQMRVYLFVIFLFTIIMQDAYSQKQLIDSLSYRKWPSVEEGIISNDGKYIVYCIKSGGWPGRTIKHVIKSTENNWQIELLGEKKQIPKFSSDSRFCVFITATDSLGIINLGSSAITYIANVFIAKLPNSGSGRWLCYQINNNEKKMIFRDLETGSENNYDNVCDYKWSEDGNSLVLQLQNKQYSLNWLNLNTGKSIQIWEDIELGSSVVDFEHNQLAINSKESIKVYKVGTSKPVLLLAKNPEVTEKSLKLKEVNYFNKKGDCLFITLEEKPVERPYDTNGVEIWSYLDKKIHSVQKNEVVVSPSFLAIIRLKDKKVIQIQRHQDEYFAPPVYDKVSVDLAFVNYEIRHGDSDERNWSKEVESGSDLVFKATGDRRCLNWLTQKLDVNISPNGKFITYFDKKINDFFSYEVTTGSIRNLTKNLKKSWFEVIQSEYKNRRGVAGWLENDKRVLVYDSYDIWKLDPLGKVPPVNLTNGYGLKHRIVFYLGLEKYTNQPISPKEKMVLNAFNLCNKDNGFFSILIDGKGDPELLTMGPYLYHLLLPNHHLSSQSTGIYPSKARDRPIYMVKRSSSNESPNYFITMDFKVFKPISNVRPEKSYNWYTTELHSWKSFDGRELQGVLYRPENFDPNKKYPVIFNYYEKMTGALNVCLKPENTQGSIDIPTFVSNGYLVFCPDIYYNIGDPMQGTYDAVVSAAKYIVNLPFVRPDKLGIQGHSFGGKQTNFLVTHTNMFAAACSASGVADWVSGYGSLYGNPIDGYGMSLQHVYETGQSRMGKSLWESRDAYLKNSSILNTDKITTPILLMHTKNDRVCPYANIIEFFLGLRRLGKKAWMLVYPEGIHSVRGKESEDFTVRMQQFFDHYLKDKPTPLWMLEGGAVKDRSGKTGLELDTAGRTPGPGLLNAVEQQKVDSLMTIKPVSLHLK